MDDRLIDLLWINRPYYFKQKAYEYEREVRFVLGCEPVHLAAGGGIVRELKAAQLIDAVLISPHLHLDEGMALKEIIRSACPYLLDSQIKISSILYPGDPESREMMWQFTERLGESTTFPDLLSELQKEADHDGIFQSLPKMMLQV